MSNATKDSLLKQCATDRKNILAICRLSVQTLCDEAGTSGVIDDNSEQLQNFCNIIETLLIHRYRVQNKKHHGTSEGITYWEFLSLACKPVPYNCIQKINLMDNVKTQRGKGRAWIRMALMEKRLSEYLSVSLIEDSLVKKFYSSGSFMLNEEAHILANVLTALNSVDFSLCMRSSHFDMPIIYSIDYSTFLKYPISDKQLDLEEALVRMERNRIHTDASSTCSGHTSFSAVSEKELTAEEELVKLKRQMKLVVDQKAYLEEILHLKEQKCTELTTQLLQWDEQVEHEKRMSDMIVLELQQQLAEQQLRTRLLSERNRSDTLQEMEPVFQRTRSMGGSMILQRPSDDIRTGVDVVAYMDRNGNCSRSSSEQSVKRSTSDISVKKSSDNTTRTSSTSGSSLNRPNRHSKQ